MTSPEDQLDNFAESIALTFQTDGELYRLYTSYAEQGYKQQSFGFKRRKRELLKQFHGAIMNDAALVAEATKQVLKYWEGTLNENRRND